MSLSTQPYKGARDYYPEDKRVQNYIFAKYREVAERFGYEEYGAPLLEPIEVYAAKTGQEIVSEQTYQFTDRGGRTVVIRPELTPSVSRMVAARRQEMAYPARLYNIGNFMRYERPQRGREREFWQLNVDIFGVAGIEADAEIIQMANETMQAFGATEKHFVIRINSRRLVNTMMSEYLGLSVIQSELMIKLFDRKDKIEAGEFTAQARDIFGETASDGLRKIAALTNVKSMAELPRELLETEAASQIRALFALLRERGVTNTVFDITLMRGLDYYTDVVFEVFDTSPENRRALFGGGRYDGLVGLFDVEPVTAVGMAPGVTAVEDFLRTHELLPEFESTTDVYIVVLSPESLPGAHRLAARLRTENVRVAVDITGRKLDKQIKTAIKLRIPYLLFIGEQELQDEHYTLKDTAAESEQKLSFERVVTAVQDYRRRDEDGLD